MAIFPLISFYEVNLILDELYKINLPDDKILMVIKACLTKTT